MVFADCRIVPYPFLMSRKPAVLKTFLLVALVSLAGCHELIMGYTTPEWTSVAKLVGTVVSSSPTEAWRST